MKKNPRSWSAPYWKTNNISDILKEVIEPEGVDVTSIKFNDELNPLIWDGDKMKEDVRKILLLNAKRFIELTDLENVKFKDVILTGSMANYNYNDGSDLDVHIVFDFNQISENDNFISEFLLMKKAIWNDRFPIQVKGHDVEMYFQDDSEPHHSTGTFSLYNNDWINKPTKKIVNVDTSNIQLKAADFMNAIDKLIKNSGAEDFLEKYTKVKDKIKKMRQSGLESGGEFSSENLAFKILRNSGYLEKLVDLKREYLTKQLSLNEFGK